MAMTAAERSKRWWKKLKDDSERHKSINKNKNEWQKKFRGKIEKEREIRQKDKADEILKLIGLK